ncbi:hypothetical protein BKA70DRAFT_1464768 [Coprinopsis sp. MPI-PUGE-AT-0042]|nr:hypothetical protein BKA70DRAFT_1464768 [Coprinopsis sp. MPI-PUGE-AT-0042]
MQDLLFFSWSHLPKSSPKLSVDRCLALSPAIHLSSSIIPIPVDNMVRASTTILLAALAAAPSFAAPVAFESRDSQGIEARVHRRQSSGVSGSTLGSRDPVGSIINQRSLQGGTRDLIDQFDMEVRNGEEKKKVNINKKEKIKPLFRSKTVDLNGVSANLANISTNGFKRSKATFEELIMQRLKRRSPGSFSSLGSVSRSTAPSYTGARRSLIEDEFTLDLAARGSQGIEARAPHRRQTTRDFDQFGIDSRGDQEDLKKKYLEYIKNDKGKDKNNNILINKNEYKNKIELKNINKKENIINKYDKKTINNFNSQPKSKKGKQRRSLGISSSFDPVIRSTAPSYTGARRSFIDDDFALDTRHRCREDSQDFLEKDSIFEAREINELD